MNDHERTMIISLATGKIRESNFLSHFRPNIPTKLLVRTMLEEAINDKNPDDVECALILGFTFGFPKNTLSSLIFLAEAAWHFKHEDIVTALSQLESPESLNVLVSLTYWIPEYLQYDDSRALAVKAIWAIAKIGGGGAQESLKSISNEGIPVVSKVAAERLLSMPVAND